ncbi:MAG: zinc-ribbon domain-containing protein [Blastocatellia bacterium]
MKQTSLSPLIDCPSCGATARDDSRFCRACGTRLHAAAAGEAPREVEPARATEEIDFDDVNASDRILIQTQNSEYRFSVVDPHSRSGKLSGGSFGNQLQDATLVGVLIGSQGNSASDTSRLKINSCALFYINVGAGLKRLTTSVITDLTLIRGGGPRRGRLR